MSLQDRPGTQTRAGPILSRSRQVDLPAGCILVDVSAIELDHTPVQRPQRRAGVLAVIALVGALGITFAPVSTQPTQTVVIEQTSDQDGYRCEITVNGTTVYAEASTAAPPDCRWPR